MAETIYYDVVKKLDRIEIRQYPAVIFAVVENQDEDSSFGLLFRYITGENKTKSRIAMSAPVITSEKIKMTAPVITRKNYMAFAVPSTYTEETVPIPTNPEVKIEVQPKKHMATLRFNRRTTTARVEKYKKELLTTLNNHGFQIKGEPILMRYNSPFTPGFLRRNEVAIEILEKE
ncbi:MAG: heme-binding protein [Euryarchaeota archaeon]|nr:heme-binding protein [Euryarchaeota archaeon]